MEKELFDNVVNDILEAEKQADSIIENAKIEAQSIQNNTVRTISDIEKQNLIDIKTVREKIINDAEQEARNNYAIAIDNAKVECKTTIDKASQNTTTIATEILRSIID